MSETKKYKTKIGIVEAMQVSEGNENAEEIYAWVGEKNAEIFPERKTQSILQIYGRLIGHNLRDASAWACPGDYVVKLGSIFQVMTKDQFNNIYESA